MLVQKWDGKQIRQAQGFKLEDEDQRYEEEQIAAIELKETEARNQVTHKHIRKTHTWQAHNPTSTQMYPKPTYIYIHAHQLQVMARMRLEKRAELRKRLTIPKRKFNHAIPLAPFCEHLHCKAWGDCYGKGVRCITCGKEITMTHEEEAQQKGLGSGDDPVMVS